MRGKAFPVYGARAVLRITPAYAGKSSCDVDNHFTRKDHPRLCGEKCNFALSFLPVLGSPPPMRGKVSLLTDFANACKGSPPPMRGKVK